MKTIALLSSVFFLFLSCSKSNNSTSYKVKYVVTGDSVNQFKISQGATDEFVKTDFSGTKDTTIYVQAGTDVKLDAKANDHNLVGSIYVNDALAVTGTDLDSNQDNKTEVKLEYVVGAKQ
jgi:hypothetical protein